MNKMSLKTKIFLIKLECLMNYKMKSVLKLLKSLFKKQKLVIKKEKFIQKIYKNQRKNLIKEKKNGESVCLRMGQRTHQLKILKDI